MKIIFKFIIAIFLLPCFVSGQKKFLVEPHVLLQYNRGFILSADGIDGTFKSPVPSFSAYIGCMAEYRFSHDKTVFISIDGTSGLLSFKSTLKGVNCRIVHSHQTEMDYTQLTIGYSQNLFIKDINKKTSFQPAASIGLGVSKNKQQDEYDTYFTRNYMSVCSSDTFKYNYNTAAENNFNLHLRFGYSFKIYVKQKEIMKIGFYYNKGLFNQFKTHLQYYHNSSAYTAYLGSRGTNFHVQIGFPITIKRWKT